MIRVIIERHCLPDKEDELHNLLIDLRGRAVRQRGYISGETLKSTIDPTHWLVISTWVTEASWKAWETTPERQEIENKVKTLLAAPDKVAVFSFVDRGGGASAHTIDR